MVCLPLVTLIYVPALALVLVVYAMSPRPKKKISKRKELKLELEEHFLPILRAAGFEGPAVFAGLDDFFHFRRRRGNDYEFLTIQFDKYKGPKFRVEFSSDDSAGVTERLGGMRTHRGPVTVDDLDVMGGKKHGFLGPSRIPYLPHPWNIWFNSRGPLCRIEGWIKRVPTGELVAKRLARLFSRELEGFWRDGRVGAHLYITEYWSGLSSGNGFMRRLAHIGVGLYYFYSLLVVGLVTLLLFVFLVVEPLAKVFGLIKGFIWK